jgi:cell division GTPase FtsZ
MKPCVVGIGGAGGNILKQFLQNMDVNLVVHQFGESLAFGDVKGLWLESARQDAQGQYYFSSLIEGHYPAYLICHGAVSDNSPTRDYVRDTYGFDLKAMGFDRRAEYLKGLFEVFETDPNLKAKCSEEFKGYQNPLSGYMWKEGIRPFTTIAMGKSNGGTSKAQYSKEGRSGQITSIPKNLKEIIKLGNMKGLNSSKLCDSVLFLASLGGGTGTGFINPITSFVRSEEAIFPIFALGILTEKGSDKRHAVEGQRYLGAVIAMYDLLTKEAGKGIDGLILMDNQILVERFNNNYSVMDSKIYEALKPLLDQRNYPGDQLQDDAPAIRRVFWEVEKENTQEEMDRAREIRLLPPMLVPCYNMQPDYVGDINTLVKGALGKAGNLFPCDPTKADRAMVFTRGYFSIKEIAEAVGSTTHLPEKKIKIYRKLGDSKNEDILILLRNPYGGEPGEHKRQGTLEWRLHEIISLSLKYIDENQENILGFQGYKDKTKEKLRNYFYGEMGLGEELYNCLDRLENGERPVFKKPLKIFGDAAIASDSSESCLVRPEILAGDRYDLRELVKAELKGILNSEDCRRRIKEILQS